MNTNSDPTFLEYESGSDFLEYESGSETLPMQEHRAKTLLPKTGRADEKGIVH